MFFDSQTVLDSFLLPSFRAEFMDEVWGKKHFVWKSDLYLNYGLNITKLKNTILSEEMSYPEVSCLSSEGVLDPGLYVDSFKFDKSFSLIQPAKLLNQLEQGYTIRLREFYNYYPSWRPLKDSFREIFKCPISFNVYLNLKANGIKPHFDVHHIFIIQMEGVKIWEIGPISTEFPRHDFAPGAAAPPSKESFSKKIKLFPGDVMYVPLGLWHKTATNQESLHLAIGVMPPDWTDVLRALTRFVSDKNENWAGVLEFEADSLKERTVNNNVPSCINPAIIRKALDILKNNTEMFCSDYFQEYVLNHEN